MGQRVGGRSVGIQGQVQNKEEGLWNLTSSHLSDSRAHVRGNTEGRIVKGPTQSEEEGTLHRGREIHEVNHGHTGAQVGVRRYTLAKWIRGEERQPGGRSLIGRK